MTEPVTKCTGQQGIDSLHDWAVLDKLNEKTTLKSGKIKHTRHLLCSTCKGRMVETMWEIKGKLVNSRMQWKSAEKAAGVRA